MMSLGLLCFFIVVSGVEGAKFIMKILTPLSWGLGAAYHQGLPTNR